MSRHALTPLCFTELQFHLMCQVRGGMEDLPEMETGVLHVLSIDETVGSGHCFGRVARTLLCESFGEVINVFNPRPIKMQVRMPEGGVDLVVMQE